MTRSRDNADHYSGATGGIANTNHLVANANIVDNDFLRVDGTSIEGRTAAETLSDIGAIGASNPTVTLGSNATFPAGHVVGHWQNNTSYTASKTFTFSTTFAEITYGANEFKVTGVTATENNILHISVYTGSIRQVNVDGYRLNVGFQIDTTDLVCAQMLTGISTNTQEVPGNWYMNYVVPASFSDKIIMAMGSEEHSTGSQLCRATAGNPASSSFNVGINVFEIQV